MGRQGHEETRSHKDQRLPRGWRAERAVSGFRWKNQQDAHPRRRRESGVTPALPGTVMAQGAPKGGAGIGAKGLSVCVRCLQGRQRGP